MKTESVVNLSYILRSKKMFFFVVLLFIWKIEEASQSELYPVPQHHVQPRSSGSSFVDDATDELFGLLLAPLGSKRSNSRSKKNNHNWSKLFGGGGQHSSHKGSYHRQPNYHRASYSSYDQQRYAPSSEYLSYGYPPTTTHKKSTSYPYPTSNGYKHHVSSYGGHNHHPSYSSGDHNKHHLSSSYPPSSGYKHSYSSSGGQSHYPSYSYTQYGNHYKHPPPPKRHYEGGLQNYEHYPSYPPSYPPPYGYPYGYPAYANITMHSQGNATNATTYHSPPPYYPYIYPPHHKYPPPHKPSHYGPKKPKYAEIDTHLNLPPVKFRLHLRPNIKIFTNTTDPLEKKPDDEEDLPYPPPEREPPKKYPPYPYHSQHHAHHYPSPHNTHHYPSPHNTHHYPSPHHYPPPPPYPPPTYPPPTPSHGKIHYEPNFAIKFDPQVITTPAPLNDTYTPIPGYAGYPYHLPPPGYPPYGYPPPSYGHHAHHPQERSYNQDYSYPNYANHRYDTPPPYPYPPYYGHHHSGYGATYEKPKEKTTTTSTTTTTTTTTTRRPTRRTTTRRTTTTRRPTTTTRRRTTTTRRPTSTTTRPTTTTRRPTSTTTRLTTTTRRSTNTITRPTTTTRRPITTTTRRTTARPTLRFTTTTRTPRSTSTSSFSTTTKFAFSTTSTSSSSTQSLGEGVITTTTSIISRVEEFSETTTSFSSFSTINPSRTSMDVTATQIKTSLPSLDSSSKIDENSDIEIKINPSRTQPAETSCDSTLLDHQTVTNAIKKNVRNMGEKQSVSTSSVKFGNTFGPEIVGKSSRLPNMPLFSTQTVTVTVTEILPSIGSTDTNSADQFKPAVTKTEIIIQPTMTNMTISNNLEITKNLKTRNDTTNVTASSSQKEISMMSHDVLKGAVSNTNCNENSIDSNSIKEDKTESVQTETMTRNPVNMLDETKDNTENTLTYSIVKPHPRRLVNEYDEVIPPTLISPDLL
ncbi:flocculation protein FLO11-like [Limulus polyphemus]|uniref:Flocculation protein FLO11-like n=1 Tax=Limulus polyphemus TaxID=6850 RepID=A0ABM1ST77_LIMPO|nr:flocculation protein FLO11-like [Limulus polyphemus]